MGTAILCGRANNTLIFEHRKATKKQIEEIPRNREDEGTEKGQEREKVVELSFGAVTVGGSAETWIFSRWKTLSSGWRFFSSSLMYI